jgi:hypothetical protein
LALGQAAWDLSGVARRIEMLVADLAGRCDPRPACRQKRAGPPVKPGTRHIIHTTGTPRPRILPGVCGVSQSLRGRAFQPEGCRAGSTAFRAIQPLRSAWPRGRWSGWRARDADGGR